MSLMSVDTALSLIRRQGLMRPMPTEMLPLEDALGRVLANDVHSRMNLPAFDNSAMDGYALPPDISDPPAGTELPVAAEIAAGASPIAGAADAALAIMTGAALPPGYHSVVPVEDVEVLAKAADGRVSRIRLLKPTCSGQNRRCAGEDIAIGKTVLSAGRLLRATDLPVLRGIGIESLPLRRRPRVAILCTGRELCAPGAALAEGQIYDTNGLSLSLLMTAAGAEVVAVTRVADDPQAFVRALDAVRALGVDAVLSSGAVSMGRYDFIPESLSQLGATTHFHKLAMRPGKPLLFATLATGEMYFGLPGNPVSSLVGARFFVAAALRAMLGLPVELPWQLPLLDALARKPALTFFQKARVLLADGGQLRVQRLEGQESFRIAPLLQANAWAVFPAEAQSLAAGALVPVFPMEPGSTITSFQE